jgi:hypothetical protein
VSDRKAGCPAPRLFSCGFQPFLARAGALAAAAALAGCAPLGETRSQESFLAWRAASGDPVAAFEDHLRVHGLDSVAPLHELLRSASSWADCGAPPYAVPPAAQWPYVRSTLLLVKELRSRGVLGEFEIHSAYRDEALNKCAGGAKGSAHFKAFAIDLVPREDDGAGLRLCEFWRQSGGDWQMGLSRYPSGRIHIDTSGYRTWGSDHTFRTSFCNP